MVLTLLNLVIRLVGEKSLIPDIPLFWNISAYVNHGTMCSVHTFTANSRIIEDKTLSGLVINNLASNHNHLCEFTMLHVFMLLVHNKC